MEVAWKKRLDNLQIRSLTDMFRVQKPVIGMVHLWPLPGSPGYAGYGMDEILDQARRDAEALIEGGVDGLIVENMWDLPYYVGTDPQMEAVVAQGVVARKVKEMAGMPVGVNVIHNGWQAELSIAIAAGLDFIRVCILTGARLWDTGDLDSGCAADLLRRRKELGAEHVKLFADVDKKHSVPFPGIDLETHIEWTEFYRPDALIVSGRMTGDAPDLDKVRRAREAATRPILMGSGTNAENIAAFLQYADGAIVGTGLKVDGVMENPIDVERVRRYVEAVEEVRARIESG
ncbi:MAG: BtpA/SgcQ family protein [Anaerolineae bacterium]|nr:BtpA/SgcQ family protein [Anaerolineae bacterium]